MVAGTETTVLDFGQTEAGTSATFAGDVRLKNGKAIKLGDDNDVTLTHIHDVGLRLNSTMQLQFGTATTHIKQVLF